MANQSIAAAPPGADIAPGETIAALSEDLQELCAIEPILINGAAIAPGDVFYASPADAGPLLSAGAAVLIRA